MSAPLAGFTVGITGHRRWEEQAEMLERRGARILHGPVMQTNLLDDSDATVAATHAALAQPVDHVILTTGIGTRSWIGAAAGAGLDDQLIATLAAATVIARGPKARSAAINAGLPVHWQATSETNAEVLTHLARAGVRGARVVVQQDGGTGWFADAVAALGARVIRVPVYTWQQPTDIAPAMRLLDAVLDRRVDAVTFTCAYAVANAFALAPDGEELRRAFAGATRAVAVGPVTADALRAHGVVDLIEPARARLGSMVRALVDDLAARHRVLRHHGTSCAGRVRCSSTP
jgi:uroporphyrinogen-III synthase